jgi:hypothetical protein
MDCSVGSFMGNGTALHLSGAALVPVEEVWLKKGEYMPADDSNSYAMVNEGLVEESASPLVLFHSIEIGALVESLAKARKAFGAVKKTAENPYFKSSYADLSGLIAATSNALSDNGLVMIQSPGGMNGGGAIPIISLLAHSSGQWIRGELMMPCAKKDAQGVGSAVTYGRRYSYQSMLNIAAEEDDDGNEATGRSSADRGASSTDKDTRKGVNINPAQQRALWAAYKQGNKTKEDIAGYYKSLGITTMEEMKKVDHDAAMKWAVGREEDLIKPLQDSVKAVHNFKLLFAKARAKGIPEDDVRKVGHEVYKVPSLTQLTPDQFDGLIEWIDQQESA